MYSDINANIAHHLPFSYKSNYTLIFVELLKSYNNNLSFSDDLLSR